MCHAELVLQLGVILEEYLMIPVLAEWGVVGFGDRVFVVKYPGGLDNNIGRCKREVELLHANNMVSKHFGLCLAKRSLILFLFSMGSSTGKPTLEG